MLGASTIFDMRHLLVVNDERGQIKRVS